MFEAPISAFQRDVRTRVDQSLRMLREHRIRQREALGLERSRRPLTGSCQEIVNGYVDAEFRGRGH